LIFVQGTLRTSNTLPNFRGLSPPFFNNGRSAFAVPLAIQDSFFLMVKEQQQQIWAKIYQSRKACYHKTEAGLQELARLFDAL
jgi:hypothetical protein